MKHILSERNKAGNKPDHRRVQRVQSMNKYANLSIACFGNELCFGTVKQDDAID